MPVSAWMTPGMVPPGLTSVDHCPVSARPLVSSSAISVMRSVAGSDPVVSTSTMASGPFMDIYTVAHFGRRRLSKIRNAPALRARHRCRRVHPDAVGEARYARRAGAQRPAGLPPGGLARGAVPVLPVSVPIPADGGGARPGDLAERRVRRSLRPPVRRGEPPGGFLHGVEGLPARPGA